MNLSRALLVVCLTLVSALPVRAQIDLNGDNISDIWVLRYNAGALAPGADADGDGETNAEEAAAGTNPFQPTGLIRITNVTRDGNGVHITFPTEPGKRYQLQSAAALTGAPNDWTDEGSPLAPDSGGSLTATDANPGATDNFYRVMVLDIDSDSDGVNDWEELQVGFDPFNSHSKGLNGPDDFSAITNALVATNVVTVTSNGVPINEPPNANVSTDVGVFTIQRTGNLNAITVNFSVTGSANPANDYTISATNSVTLPMGVNSATVSVIPLADSTLESPEAVILTATAGAGYDLGTPKAASVLINDYSQANGTGLTARFWEEGSAALSQTILPTFTGTAINGGVYPGLNQTTASWGSPNPNGTRPAGLGTDLYWSSRWTGEVLAQYSQVYTFSLETNFAGRLFVGGQLVVNNWPPAAVASSSSDTTGTPTATRVTGTIDLVAGKRYPIVVEHYNNAGTSRCYLRWQSANQAEEYIPATRLFPNPPPQILSETDVLLLQGGPVYNYQIVASGSPTSYAASNLPAGWTINTSTGLITGSPNTAGTWAITLTATNAVGSGSAVLNLEIISTGAMITRDVWTGLPGTAVSSIPLDTNPTTTGNISTLEGPQNSADDYGARIRGYITAPLTGVYKFFIAASDTAELWISDDDDPVNIFKRAQVLAPTNFREWTNVNAGKSSLLQLFAGRRYYVEVRHKAGVGADHVSVGWLKPGEGLPNPAAATAPSEVVPSYPLSPFVPPTIIPGESTLFTTNLSAEAGVTSNGYGAASLRLSADETQAILVYSYANLNSTVSAKHIHSDAHGGQIIFDIDTAPTNPDGSHTWNIVAVGAISAADVVNVIKNGDAYLNVHTATYPNGEIRGNFHLTAASQTFTPPPPQTWTDPMSAGSTESSQNDGGAARFLVQATFGAQGRDADADGVADSIEEVKALGFEGWINNQFTLPASPLYPYVFANRVQTDGNGGPTYPGSLLFRSWWQRAVTAPDQLRQRVAFALSEIVVTSEDGPLDDRSDALSSYYDMLLNDSFGNFYNVLEDVTLHPAMGRYLDMLNNRKPNLTAGRIPNENYAREIEQLFSIGLNRMHPDGSLILNSKGEIIPTYDQDAIVGFAHVFTGWTYHYTDVLNGVNPATYRTSNTGTANWLQPMQPVPLEHFTGQKRLLNNVVLPGLPVVGGQPLDPYASHSAAQYNDPAYQQLVRQELDVAHATLFNHENTGPFICRQLIQRLVTGTPSRGYLYRVVQKFNNNGSGVRGDMKAVIKAILLDYEARSSTAATAQGFGKQREPIVRVAGIARGFPAPPAISGTYEQGQNGDPLSFIRVTTSAPHLYTGTQTIYLEFVTGTPSAPDDGLYSSTVSSTTQFNCRALTTQTATYAQTNDVIRVTIPSTHTYNVGNSLYIDFTSGTPSAPPDGFYTVVVDDPNDIFLDVRPLSAVAGTYSQTATTITVTAAGHTVTAGSTVYLDFTTGTPDSPVDGLFTVDTSTPGTSFTVTAADSVSRTGNVFATPSADVVNRTGNAMTTKAAYAVASTGTINVTYSDWRMDETDNSALAQTPMRSPTVFNFFVPDYQFPGRLSQAGLITPEFQITSETTVIDQANFLYNGIYNDFNSIPGLCSFKSGGRAIVLDLRPWMGTGPSSLPWAHNNNLYALIDKLSVQLMGATLPTTPGGVREKIRNFVATLSYTTPTTTQLRDRVRATVHLIVTSPQYTVQK
jgi:hypothetical protein